jgi:Domain of unknown function (DUF4129)
VVTAPPAGGVTRPAGYLAGSPPLAGRATARGMARTELAKPIYHQGTSLTDRVIAKIISFFGGLVRQANSAVPGGWWTLVVLGAAAVILIGVVLARLGPVSRAHRDRGGPLRGGGTVTAHGHRVAAQQLAAAGDWSGAIRETLRAIAAELEERAILPPRAGRTADELAAEAGRALPEHGGELGSAARIFDDVCYGQRPGTEHGYARLRDLDAAVRVARPLPLAPPAGPPGAPRQPAAGRGAI